MKLLFRITAICLMFFMLLSCSKDESNPTNVASTDEYYVKYQIKGIGIYNYFSNFSVQTEQKSQSFSGYQYNSWTQTYGPVKKGFVASVSVQGNVTAEIYVSKNNGPFALKASKSSASTSATYTIDF
jgi:outer membrane biogenesis lipoprotein LolB